MRAFLEGRLNRTAEVPVSLPSLRPFIQHYWRVAGLAVAISCAAADVAGPPQQQQGKVTAVEIAAPSTSLAAGGSVQLTVTLRDATGSLLTGRPVVWASSNASVATVSSAGLLTAIAPGSTTISASSETVTYALAFTVRPSVAAVRLNPASLQLQPAQRATVVAVTLDALGNATTGDQVTWGVGNPLIASIDIAAGGLSATLIGGAPGTTLVTATAGGISATASVSVTIPVASVQVSPSATTLQVGQSTQLAATPLDGAGKPVAAAVTWASSNSAVATVDASGRVTGIAIGSTNVVASSGGVSGVSAIVVAAPAVASVTLDVSTATIQPGQDLNLSATTFDAGGKVLSGRTVTWTISNSSVATVSSSGVVHGVAQGTALVTATSEGQSASSTITVAAVAPTVFSIAVSPASIAILPGDQRQLSATALGSSQQVIPNVSFSWISSQPAVASVNASGLVTALTAGSTTVTATGAGKSGSSAVTVTAVTSSTPTITKIAGDGQSANVGTKVAILPSVQVRDAAGNVAAGIQVTFTVASGGGTITGGSQTTNAQGVATVGAWFLGGVAGTNTLSATVAGASPVTFSATGIVTGAPVQLAFTPGPVTTRANMFMSRVLVTFVDASGRGPLPVPSTPVTLTITPGTGAVGALLGVSPCVNCFGTTLVSANGFAAFNPTITLPGTYTLTASAPGYASATSAPFDITPNPGLRITLDTLQRAQWGGSSFRIRVTDAANSPVAGVMVSLDATPATNGPSLSITDNTGTILAAAGLAPLTGTMNTVTATIVGTSTSASANVVSQSGPPVQYLKYSGDYQTGVAGSPLPQPVVMKAADQYGNGVPGVPVIFLTTGGGVVNAPPNQLTDGNGLAAIGFVLPSKEGIYPIYAGFNFFGGIKGGILSPFLESTGRISPDMQIGFGLPGSGQVVHDSLIVSVQVVGIRPLASLTATVNGRTITLPGPLPPRCSGCLDLWRATMYIGDMPAGTMYVKVTAVDASGVTVDAFQYFDHAVP